MKELRDLRELRELMILSELWMSEISKKSKVSESTLSRIMNDPNYDPKFSTVNKIKKAVTQHLLDL